MLEVLLVDDEPTIRLSVGDALSDAGYHVTLAADGAEASALVTKRVYDVVISDIRMPKLDGLSLFHRIREVAPETDVILVTAYGAVEDAVLALKDGARDYLTKPFDTDELLVRLARLAERHDLRRQLADARKQLARKEKVRDIIGDAPPMIRLMDRIETFADTEAPVLVLGESGTGKELIAQRLHHLSSRADRAFVAVHCAAFPETLIEAELFGHERGAFTGAVRRRDGRFKVADGGTLFLDEVAEIPLPAQAKLLRVVQDGCFEPLGTSTPVRVDVRLISATHRDLKRCVQEGTFREDLYYRLNVLDLTAPPLRDRRADLPVLVEHFLRRFSPDPDKPPAIAPQAWAALTNHPFPGNVRELEHAIQHAVVLSRGAEIQAWHLPRDVAGDDVDVPHSPQSDTIEPLSTAIKAFEHEYLLRALRTAEGKRSKAAQLLGISRKNLWEKLKSHDISDEDLL